MTTGQYLLLLFKGILSPPLPPDSPPLLHICPQDRHLQHRLPGFNSDRNVRGLELFADNWHVRVSLETAPIGAHLIIDNCY